METWEKIDAAAVDAAVEKARQHALCAGKPLNLARVALYMGITSDEFATLEQTLEKCKDEKSKNTLHALKRAKQETRSDLEDCLAEGGNRGGFIFLGKVNHGMIERSVQDLNVKAVTFEGESEIPD